MPKITIAISGMHCASCALNIEQALKKVKGVRGVNVNYAVEKAFVEYDPVKTNPSILREAIRKAGYKAVKESSGADKEREARQNEINDLRFRFIFSFLLSLLLMYLSMLVNSNSSLLLIELLLATMVILTGQQFFISGTNAILKAHNANMDTLVALGVGSAYLYSVFASVYDWLGRGSFH
ncbi:MAG: cation transporter, partial [Candidatus Omnitrophota bacterium]